MPRELSDDGRADGSRSPDRAVARRARGMQRGPRRAHAPLPDPGASGGGRPRHAADAGSGHEHAARCGGQRGRPLPRPVSRRAPAHPGLPPRYGPQRREVRRCTRGDAAHRLPPLPARAGRAARLPGGRDRVRGRGRAPVPGDPHRQPGRRRRLRPRTPWRRGRGRGAVARSVARLRARPGCGGRSRLPPGGGRRLRGGAHRAGTPCSKRRTGRSGW